MSLDDMLIDEFDGDAADHAAASAAPWLQVDQEKLGKDLIDLLDDDAAAGSDLTVGRPVAGSAACLADEPVYAGRPAAATAPLYSGVPLSDASAGTAVHATALLGSTFVPAATAADCSTAAPVSALDDGEAVRVDAVEDGAVRQLTEAVAGTDLLADGTSLPAEPVDTAAVCGWGVEEEASEETELTPEQAAASLKFLSASEQQAFVEGDEAERERLFYVNEAREADHVSSMIEHVGKALRGDTERQRQKREEAAKRRAEAVEARKLREAERAEKRARRALKRAEERAAAAAARVSARQARLEQHAAEEDVDG